MKNIIWTSIKYDLFNKCLVKIDRESAWSNLKESQTDKLWQMDWLTVHAFRWSGMVKIKKSIGMVVSGFHFVENDYRWIEIWNLILSRFLSLKSSSVSIFNFSNQYSSKLWSLRFFSIFFYSSAKRLPLDSCAFLERDDFLILANI